MESKLDNYTIGYVMMCFTCGNSWVTFDPTGGMICKGCDTHTDACVRITELMIRDAPAKVVLNLIAVINELIPDLIELEETIK